jgi:hypothetical protein
MIAVPWELAHDNPAWLTYITRGLLDVQVPPEPSETGIEQGMLAAVAVKANRSELND